jgi:hypothetical protein
MKRHARGATLGAMVGLGLVVAVALPGHAAGGGTWPEDELLVAAVVGETDYFGWAIDTDGATALIGSVYDDEGPYGNAGSVYVFDRGIDGWTQADRLVADDFINSAFFGAAVSMSGDSAVFGAYGVEAKKGAAYVFVSDGASWTEQQKLTVATGVAFDYFGQSAAIDGDTVVVGAYGHDHSLVTDPGAAYVFTRSGTTWSLEQELTADSPDDDDWFGYSVAIDGDTIVVGALEVEAASPYRSGSAYVFTRSGSTWTQSQKLNGSGGADDRNFGASVDIDGDTVVVGANRANEMGIDRAGAAYVFTGSGGIWTEQQRLTASDPAEFAGFGKVAIDGDTVLVGADLADVDGVYRAGKAYVFVRVGGVWSEQQKLVAGQPQDQAQVGYAVALSSELAFVAAPFADVGPTGDAGVVCSYAWASQVFADGLETGDPSQWTSSVP